MDDRIRNLSTGGEHSGDTIVARHEPPSEAQYMALVDGERGFASRYKDVAALGQGGMGEVRLCIDRHTERDVAIKRIDKARRSTSMRSRFLREARIQAQLDHPTIIPVYDIGVDEEGFEYFTMKRALGMTLDEILADLRAKDPSACARYTLPVRLGIFRQVCQGIEYAHSRGIIHRDLKPENVMVGELGEVYVIDWGIAKVARAPEESGPSRVFRTGGGTMLGTPGYLAPEQSIDAELVDERADVYALGAILFELLTLEPLHTGNNIDALLQSTLHGRGDARISMRVPELEIAPELERACVLATKTEPNERLASVSELVAVVAGYLDGDRDLALRRSLAQPHAQAAAASLAQLVTSGDPDDRVRARALREAGHALALDPQSKSAIEVITKLMATAPATLPEEAAAMLAQHENISASGTARSSMWSYLGFAVLIVGMLFVVRVHNWLAIAAMALPLMVATGVAATRALRPSARPPVMLALGAVLVAISATSTLYGPYVLMPALLAAFATTSIGAVTPVMQRPLLWSVMCLLAAVTPMLLQAVGVLPVGFTITAPGSVLIQHRITDASPAMIQATLVLVTLATIFTPMLFTYRTALQLRETRAKLVVHMWHLRQLTPAS